MKKLLLSLCMVLALIACKDEKKNEAKEKPVVKIGASFPLSGNMASIGNAAHKALAAAINDVNAQPDNKYTYKLLVENDQMDPKTINNLANKFIFSDKVNAIVSYFSVANRIVAPLAAQHKIINFMFGFGDDSLLSKYNFQNFLTIDDENSAIINFFKEKNISSVDLIYQNIGAADEFLKPLLPRLDAENIAYTIHRFNKGERDFAILISKIKETSSQAIFIYAFEPEADILTKELRHQNIQKIIAYNDGLPMANDYNIYEGYYNIGSIMTPEHYRIAWGLSEQNAAYSAYLYDTGRIIADAFENAPTDNKIPTSDEIAAYLHSKTKYNGIVGIYQLDDKGQFHSKGETTIVKNGEQIFLGE